jgi:hypothetical protein
MIRVAGKVEFIRDKALEERLYRDQLWVRDVIAAVPRKEQNLLSSG